MFNPSNLRGYLLLVLFSLSDIATALQPSHTEAAAKPIAATGTVTLAFTPEQNGAGLIVDAINQAHQQILVQAYSFTHHDIAQALIAAHRRSVEVIMIADREQTQTMAHTQVAALATAGVPIWLDGAHLSAHNKVMVIDADSANATVITGSFNFTNAAQFRNAENLLILRGNQALASAFKANWQRHLQHSQAF
jgi:phosphatidylserine/phosphatidylglycerophosphate/cardiolipin synthase-like enzyme